MQIRSASNTNEVNWDDPLNKGLVSWYSFKQKGGNVLRDVVGNYDGTLTGMDPGTDWVPSPENKSRALDISSTEYVNLGNNQGIVGVPQFTVAFWLKPSSASMTNNGVLSYRDGVSQDEEPFTIRYFTAGVLRALVVNDSDQAKALHTVTAITDTDRWYHLTVTWTSLDFQYWYVDGVEDASTNTYGGVTGDTTRDLWLGAYYSTAYSAVGQYSDLRMYDRALSGQEVSDLYQASRTGYVNQFKRRYFPVSLQTEEPPTETATSGLIRLRSPKPTNEVNWDDPLNKGLVSWYPMKQKGGDLIDIAGGHNASLGDGLYWEPDGSPTGNGVKRINSPADFDNSAVVDVDSIDFTSMTGLTIFVWARSIDSTSYFPAGLLSGASDWTYIRPSGASVRFRATDGTNDTSYYMPFGWSDDEWHCYALSLDGSTLRSFADGKTNSTSATFDFSAVDGQFRIGGINTVKRGDWSDIRIYNRALSLGEIQELYDASRTGYKNQYKRRYFPVSLQTEEPLTLLEKIRSVAKPTTTRALSVKKNSVPSYKAGYAKSASESANPGLWDGLRGAWYPQMGESGSTLMDLSGGKMNASRIGQIDWLQSNEDGGLTCDYFGRDAGAGDSSAFDIVNSSSVHPYGDIGSELTIICRVRRDINNTSVAEGNWYVGNTVFELRQETTTGCNVPFSVGQKAVATDEVYWSIGFTDNFTTNAEKVFSDVNVGNVNTWTHGAVTVSNNTVQWYSKGEPWGGGTISTATGDRSVGSVASNMQIGSGSASNGVKEFNEFGGRISEVLLYDRVLTHREIKQLYVDPLAPFRKKTTVGYQPSKELRGLFRT